jgi:phosphinothricin acetyltransferase
VIEKPGSCSGFCIRPVSPRDAASICGIYNYYIENTVITFEEEPVSVESMEARIKTVAAKYPWLVYEEAGEILGYAFIHAWHERSAYRFTAEDSIYLKHGKQGQGIGKTLFARLLEEVRKRDIRVLMSVITVPNQASTVLHERFGFKQAGCFSGVGFKFGRRLDVGYWELMLDEKPENKGEPEF